MYNRHSKPINLKLIIIAAAVGLAIAVAAVIILLSISKKSPVPTDTSSNSSASQKVDSSSDVSSDNNDDDETTESKPEPEKPKLTVTTPDKTSLTTTNSTFTLSGSSDPTLPLTLNGAEVTRDEKGFFALDLSLSVGKNTFTLVHGKETKTFTVTYRYVVIESYSPSTAQKYSSGSTFGVSATARRGSSVSATFNGQTINLVSAVAEEGAEFVIYNGNFTLPKDNLKDLSLGKVKFTASHSGVTESFYSGNITCRKPSSIVDSDPAVTPTGGNYVDVGSGLIAEVVHFQAEAFDAYSTNDWSSPRNNYLPKGTVDYVSSSRVYHSSGKTKKEYAVLRYGKQVYTKIQDNLWGNEIQIIKEYAGTLPDHNEIKLAAMSEEGRFTTLTFDCLFKAPFNFNIPQNYTNPSRQDYSISSFNASYVDIVFCYATVFEGEIAISDTNPLFNSAEIIKNPSGADHTLRLHLKKTGGFYGWDAYYNSEGQLVFEFLHPAKITAAENSYGYDLTGITVLVDAGHNGTGVDPGAPGLNSKNHEAERNLNLAKKIKAELEKLGATVVMTRDSDVSNITYQGRIEKLKNTKPDFCISVHHNSNNSSRPKGFSAFYGTAYSFSATQLISDRTENKAIYSEIDPYDWHYFFLARTSNCPVVLTENGFMSNSEDFSGIINDAINDKKATAIVEGIVDYFKSIQ